MTPASGIRRAPNAEMSTPPSGRPSHRSLVPRCVGVARWHAFARIESMLIFSLPARLLNRACVCADHRCPPLQWSVGAMNFQHSAVVRSRAAAACQASHSAAAAAARAMAGRPSAADRPVGHRTAQNATQTSQGQTPAQSRHGSEPTQGRPPRGRMGWTRGQWGWTEMRSAISDSRWTPCARGHVGNVWHSTLDRAGRRRRSRRTWGRGAWAVKPMSSARCLSCTH